MDVTQQAITVRDLVPGFTNNPDHGVQGYSLRDSSFVSLALFFVQLFASSDSHKH